MLLKELLINIGNKAKEMLKNSDKEYREEHNTKDSSGWIKLQSTENAAKTPKIVHITFSNKPVDQNHEISPNTTSITTKIKHG